MADPKPSPLAVKIGTRLKSELNPDPGLLGDAHVDPAAKKMLDDLLAAKLVGYAELLVSKGVKEGSSEEIKGLHEKGGLTFTDEEYLKAALKAEKEVIEAAKGTSSGAAVWAVRRSRVLDRQIMKGSYDEPKLRAHVSGHLVTEANVGIKDTAEARKAGVTGLQKRIREELTTSGDIGDMLKKDLPPRYREMLNAYVDQASEHMAKVAYGAGLTGTAPKKDMLLGSEELAEALHKVDARVHSDVLLGIQDTLKKQYKDLPERDLKEFTLAADFARQFGDSRSPQSEAYAPTAETHVLKNKLLLLTHISFRESADLRKEAFAKQGLHDEMLKGIRASMKLKEEPVKAYAPDPLDDKAVRDEVKKALLEGKDSELITKLLKQYDDPNSNYSHMAFQSKQLATGEFGGRLNYIIEQNRAELAGSYGHAKLTAALSLAANEMEVEHPVSGKRLKQRLSPQGIVIPNQEERDRSIETISLKLLKEHKGLALGEFHELAAMRQFAARYMPELSKEGKVKPVFMEVPNEMVQSFLAHGKVTAADLRKHVLPSDLKVEDERLEDATEVFTDMLKGVAEAAKANGGRLLGHEMPNDMKEALAKKANMKLSEWSQSEAGVNARNAYAVTFVRENVKEGESYLIILGSAHTGDYEAKSASRAPSRETIMMQAGKLSPKYKGLDKLLGIPSIDHEVVTSVAEYRTRQKNFTDPAIDTSIGTMIPDGQTATYRVLLPKDLDLLSKEHSNSGQSDFPGLPVVGHRSQNTR